MSEYKPFFNQGDTVIILDDDTFQGVRRKWKVDAADERGYVYLSAPGLDEVAEQRTIRWEKLLLWERGGKQWDM